MDISPGDTFGKLTVLDRAGVDGSGNSVWRCRCECGREHLVPQRSLVTGNSLSCGCLRGSPRDHAGIRYSFLVGIRPSCRRAKCGNLYWWWRCDCGREVELLASNVTRGNTKSCGCYRERVVYRRTGFDITSKTK